MIYRYFKTARFALMLRKKVGKLYFQHGDATRMAGLADHLPGRWQAERGGKVDFGKGALQGDLGGK